MIRPTLILAVLLGAALLLELSLGNATRPERAAPGEVGRILGKAERQALGIAAVRLEFPGGERFIFVRSEGGWRPYEFPGQADGRALDKLIEGLLDATGLVVSNSNEDASKYGVTSSTALRISLCGPNVTSDPAGDVKIAFDIGYASPARHQTFLRRRGERAIWAANLNPRATLESRVQPHLPPLLDPLLIPASWPGRTEGITRFTVQQSGGESFTLERLPKERDATELRNGARPWTWTRFPAGEDPVDQETAQAFADAIEQAIWQDVLAPNRAHELVPKPAALLLLETSHGTKLELQAGAPMSEGFPVWIPDYASLTMLDAALFSQLFPARLVDGPR